MENLQEHVSLQINISPTDYPLCKQLLATQIMYFYELVQEVVLTVETKKSNSSRFGVAFEHNRGEFEELLQNLIVQFPKVRLVLVNYDPILKKEITSKFFCNIKSMPDKDYRGGPFYSYFFGLYSCDCRYVIHMDSDMFIGGEPSRWLLSALKLLQEPSIFFVNPLPGPPTADFRLKQPYFQRLDRYTYYFKHVTTRFFLADLTKLTKDRLVLKFVKPSFKRLTEVAKDRTFNFWETPENLFSDLLEKNGGYRVCYWGENDSEGCYTLHPLRKPQSFITYIPILLQRIKENDFPESQRGWYNVHRDIFDGVNTQ